MKKKLDILSLNEKERDDYINNITIPSHFYRLLSVPDNTEDWVTVIKCKLIDVRIHNKDLVVVYGHWNKHFREWEYHADTYEQVQRYIYEYEYRKASEMKLNMILNSSKDTL